MNPRPPFLLAFAATASAFLFSGPIGLADQDAALLTGAIRNGGWDALIYYCRPAQILLLLPCPDVAFYCFVSQIALIAALYFAGRAIFTATGSVVAALVPAAMFPAIPILNQVAALSDDNAVQAAVVAALLFVLIKDEGGMVRSRAMVVGILSGVGLSLHVEFAPIAAVAVLLCAKNGDTLKKVPRRSAGCPRFLLAAAVALGTWAAAYALFFALAPGASVDGLVGLVANFNVGNVYLPSHFSFSKGVGVFLVPATNPVAWALLIAVGAALYFRYMNRGIDRRVGILGALFVASLALPFFTLAADPERWANAATILLIGVGLSIGGWINGVRPNLRSIAAGILIAVFLISGVWSGTEKTRDAKTIETFKLIGDRK